MSANHANTQHKQSNYREPIEHIMAKKKKSRKGGLIGTPKAMVPRPEKPANKQRTNKAKGNKAGTRQQIAESAAQANANKNKANPKLGSKTPIDLSAYKNGKPAPNNVPEAEAVTYKTPQEELAAIESNLELEQLLEKQLSEKLTKTEQAFVTKLTTRYADLCELLGIEPEEIDDLDDSDNEKPEDNDDPFARLDAIKLDDFKD